jgi:hypothetical protein
LNGRRLRASVMLAVMLLSTWSCGVAVRGVDRAMRSVAASRLFHRGRSGPLTARQREWARAAWRHFEANRHPSTGLVAAVEKGAATTMWTIADYIAALVVAREMGLVDATQFDERFRRIMHFLVDGAGGDHARRGVDAILGHRTVGQLHVDPAVRRRGRQDPSLETEGRRQREVQRLQMVLCDDDRLLLSASLATQPWDPDYTYGFGYFDWHPRTSRFSTTTTRATAFHGAAARGRVSVTAACR